MSTSRKYAGHPHLASSDEDFDDAKEILQLFQNQLNIIPPTRIPLFSAGTPESRNATLGIKHLKEPTAWIDVYYPVLDTPLDRHLQILADDGSVVWNADVEETNESGDPAGEYARTIGAWHGLSKSGDVTVSYARLLKVRVLIESCRAH